MSLRKLTTKNILASLFCWLFFTISADAQKSISGVVYAGDTQRPLAKATVRIGHRNVKTDANGAFTLPYSNGSDLEVYSGGFHEFKRDTDGFIDWENVQIYLVPKTKRGNLKISAEAIGVYEPNFEYLFDFEFYNDLLLVGSYLNRQIGSSEDTPAIYNCALTLFDRGEMIDRIIIPNFPIRFRRSPFNEVFLEGSDYAILIDENGGKIGKKEMEYVDYIAEVLPWTVAFSHTAFGVLMVREIPQVIHTVYHLDSEKYKKIRTVRNRSYFAQTGRDYAMLTDRQKSEAMALSLEQGFEEKYYGSYLRSTQRQRGIRRQNMDVHSVSRDVRHPYAPAYKYGDNMVIVDAMNQWIYHHDQWGGMVDSVYFQIELNGEELWQIKQDRVDEKLYTIHIKGGVYYIRTLNPLTGSLSKPMKIAYTYPEKLKIYNGSAFYIRHDTKQQIKHLYKEPLNF